MDRQMGLTVFGNLKGQGALNFSHWMAVFSGTGMCQFTRFSQNGGGQLRGYPDPSQSGQYRFN